MRQWYCVRHEAQSWTYPLAIADPANKAKVVVLTDAGLERAEELFRALFTKAAR